MRGLRRARLAVLVAVLGLLVGGGAFGDELAEFEKGRNSYSAGRYEEAAERFGDLLDPDHEERLRSPDLVERARIYWAASLIALGRLGEADEVIEAALRANPGAYPDPVIFPGPVVDRFTEVRGRIRQELEAKAAKKAHRERLRMEREMARRKKEKERVQKLEELARREVQVVRNSRWLAALPFGVGQFQNDQDALGWTFLTAEAALATTTLVTAAIVMDIQSKGNEPNVDRPSLNDRVTTLETINHWTFAAFVLTAAGGVAHAQLTFVPTKEEVRVRPLPDELRAEPTVSKVPGGAVFGVRGTF